MKLNISINRILVLLLSLLTAHGAFAVGTSDGGGGVGVFCASSKLELLDLYEARRSGAEIVEINSIEHAISFISEKLGNHFYNPALRFSGVGIESFSFLYKTNYVEAILRDDQYAHDFDLLGNPIFAPVRYVNFLPLYPDVGEVTLGSGCNLVQIAYMFDDPKDPHLKIVKPLWDILDATSKAALVAHETAYRLHRSGKNIFQASVKPAMQNSKWTRQFIGRIFSNINTPTYSADLPYMLDWCVDHYGVDIDGKKTSTEIFAYEEGNDIKGVVGLIQGFSDLYQLRFSLKNLSLRDLHSSNSFFSRYSSISFAGMKRESGFGLLVEKHLNRSTTVQLIDNRVGSSLPIGAKKVLSCASVRN